MVTTGGQRSILKVVNHVLKESSSIRALSYAVYSNPDLPVALEVMSLIFEIIKSE